jgi:hypothetical protein
MSALCQEETYAPQQTRGCLLVLVLGLELLLLLDYGRRCCSGAVRIIRASRSPNVRAISRHCCVRRRYSSALRHDPGPR